VLGQHCCIDVRSVRTSHLVLRSGSCTCGCDCAALQWMTYRACATHTVPANGATLWGMASTKCVFVLVQDLLGYRLDEAVDRAEAAGIVLTPSSSSTRLRALSASSAAATLEP